MTRPSDRGRTRIAAPVLLSWALAALAFPAQAQPPILAYLLRGEGQVELRREAWTSFHPIQAGAPLRAGDQLRLAADAMAVVLCADFATPPWRPTRGVRSAVLDACPRKPELLALPDGLTAGTRAGHAATLRVRTPRGWIRDDAPWIRWQAAMEGKFEARVLLGSRAIWGWVLVSGTEQRMPPGFLEPGLPYRLQVRRYRQQALVETEIPFTLLDAEKRQEIRQEESKLLALFPQEGLESRLSRALYLAHQHLWDEALALFDALAPDLPASTAAELLRGRLALGLALLDVAEERLTRARALAGSHGDLETEAAALAALASIAANGEQKTAWLEAAQALYRKLGDAAAAEDLRGRLGSSP